MPLNSSSGHDRRDRHPTSTNTWFVYNHHGCCGGYSGTLLADVTLEMCAMESCWGRMHFYCADEFGALGGITEALQDMLELGS